MKKLFLLIFCVTQIAHAEFFPQGGGNTLGLSCSDGQVPEWTGAGFTLCLTPSGAGTVTSVNTNSTSSSIFVNTANVIGTAVATMAFQTQAKNKVFVGPSSGSDAAPTFRLLVGADLPNPASGTLGGVNSKAAVTHNFLTQIGTDGSVSQAQPAFSDISGSVAAAQLPNPTASTLGGIESYAAVTHQWINTISTSGVPSSSQPAFTDVSGSLAGSQLPTFTGDVTNSSAAMTVAKIQGTTVSGTTGTGNVVFSAGPTLTGTTAMASASITGTFKLGNYHIEPAETDVGNSGTTQALDLSVGNVFTYTLNNACTITLSNPVAGAAYAIILTQDGTGSRVVTWAGTTMIWSGGVKTLSTAANAVDKVSCVYDTSISKLLCDLGTAYQ